jgi:hypothetical protein
MPKSLILLLSLLGSGAIFADKYTEIEGLSPLPRFLVKTIHETIVVDGKLAENVCAQTPPITLMFPWDFQTGKNRRPR